MGQAKHDIYHLEIDSYLIRELDKYGFDLERFCAQNDIKFKYAPLPTEYAVAWTGDHTGTISDGKLTCHFSYNSHRDIDHINIIYRNRSICSHWQNCHTAGIKTWLDAILADIKANDKQPQKFNLAQRVGSLLPLGYKAFADGFTKTEIYRSKSKYAYIIENGNKFIISKSPMPKTDSLKAESIAEAVQVAIAMIDSM